MKNKAFFPVIFLLFPVALRAQEGLYLQTGLNACNMTSTGYNTFQKPGLYASFGKSEELEWLPGGLVQYGVAFSQKGARKAPDPKNGDFFEYNIRLNYAEVPVNFMFKMKSIKGLLGLSAGYLVNQTEKGLNGIPLAVPTKYSKIDLMGTIGFAVPIGNRFLASLKGSMSLLPTIPLSRATTSAIAFARASRNQVISIGVTYVFVRKKVTEESEEDEE